MIRKITSCCVDAGCDLVVQSLDTNHTLYKISDFNTQSNPYCYSMSRYCKPNIETYILFQEGDIKEKGRNGLNASALLAVVADHLSKNEENKDVVSAIDLIIEHLREQNTAKVDSGDIPKYAPCPCSASDKKCDAPLPSGVNTVTSVK